MRRGALPGRKPSILTSCASLRNAASIARSKSAAGIATWSLTLLSSRGSTVVVSGMGLRSLLVGVAGPGVDAADPVPDTGRRVGRGGTVRPVEHERGEAVEAGVPTGTVGTEG